MNPWGCLANVGLSGEPLGLPRALLIGFRLERICRPCPIKVSCWQPRSALQNSVRFSDTCAWRLLYGPHKRPPQELSGERLSCPASPRGWRNPWGCPANPLGLSGEPLGLSGEPLGLSGEPLGCPAGLPREIGFRLEGICRPGPAR